MTAASPNSPSQNDVVTFQAQAQSPSVPVPGSPEEQLPRRRSGKGVLFGCLGLFLFLFLLSIAFLVIMLFQNPTQNPLLGALGIEPALFRNLLSYLVNGLFGVLTLASMLVVLVGLFRRFTATKLEAQKKKSSLIMMFAGGLFGLFSVFMWVVLYYYISQVQLVSGPGSILSEPADTINLVAPVDVVFSAVDLTNKYYREGVVSYTWDLNGDGKFDEGNGEEIQYTYASKINPEGVVNVGVEVILGMGQTVTFQKLVTIANVRPKLTATVRPTTPRAGQVITFDATASSDPDGRIISTSWSFDGDDVTDLSGSMVEWSYEEPGDRQVLVTILDNNGEKVEKKLTVTVLEAEKKNVSIKVAPGVEGQVPFEAVFDGSESDVLAPIKEYAWDFGDGSFGDKGKKVKHVYSKPGTYEASLSVRDEEGVVTRGAVTITVKKKENAPVAVITVEGAPEKGGIVAAKSPITLTFDGSKSSDTDGGITEYRWDTDGDMTIDDIGVRATRTYTDGGEYKVRLLVTDNDALETESIVTLQLTKDNIRLSVVPSVNAGSAPLQVTFDASGSSIDKGKVVSYRWDFGDGTGELLGSAVQVHVFQKVGEYVVTVTAISDTSEEGSTTVPIVVRNTELQSDFSFQPSEVTLGAKIFFDGSSSTGSIERYYWDFGDGGISRVVKPDHTFTKAGTYSVSLEVFDHQQNVSKKVMEVVVR